MNAAARYRSLRGCIAGGVESCAAGVAKHPGVKQLVAEVNGWRTRVRVTCEVLAGGRRVRLREVELDQVDGVVTAEEVREAGLCWVAGAPRTYLEARREAWPAVAT